MDRKTKSYESEDGSPRKGNDPLEQPTRPRGI